MVADVMNFMLRSSADDEITIATFCLNHRFGRLIRELRALPMATTPGGENNLLYRHFLSYFIRATQQNVQFSNLQFSMKTSIK